jgi:hypothetical protein
VDLWVHINVSDERNVSVLYYEDGYSMRAEDGGSMFLRNVRKHPQVQVMLQRRIPVSRIVIFIIQDYREIHGVSLGQ